MTNYKIGHNHVVNWKLASDLPQQFNDIVINEVRRCAYAIVFVKQPIHFFEKKKEQKSKRK